MEPVEIAAAETTTGLAAVDGREVAEWKASMGRAECIVASVASQDVGVTVIPRGKIGLYDHLIRSYQSV